MYNLLINKELWIIYVSFNLIFLNRFFFFFIDILSYFVYCRLFACWHFSSQHLVCSLEDGSFKENHIGHSLHVVWITQMQAFSKCGKNICASHPHKVSVGKCQRGFWKSKKDNFDLSDGIKLIRVTLLNDRLLQSAIEEIVNPSGNYPRNLIYLSLVFRNILKSLERCTGRVVVYPMNSPQTMKHCVQQLAISCF